MQSLSSDGSHAPHRAPVLVDLALQGGGAHRAFTWEGGARPAARGTLVAHRWNFRHLGRPHAYLLDLVGTLVFALSGAMAGVKRKLDVFGVLVLSFVAANAGGITRDILIGAVPPGQSAIGDIWVCRSSRDSSRSIFRLQSYNDGTR